VHFSRVSRHFTSLCRHGVHFKAQVVMVDEQEQDALSAEMKCKVLTYNLHKKSKETA